MTETVKVPVSVLRKMAEASEAFQVLEDELEDFLISQDSKLLSRLRRARAAHRKGKVRPFSQVRNAW